MSQWIDIIASTVIGGLVMLMLFGVNSRISTTSANMINSTFTSRNITDAGTILEYDLFKLGYRAEDSIITTAEINKIIFKGDLLNDSIPDVIQYSMGTTSQTLGTKNPNDRPLYRTVNGSQKMVSIVRDFKIDYLDSLGNNINYSLLTTQDVRDDIRGLRLYLKLEPADPVEGLYPFIEWRRSISPKSLATYGH